VGSGPPDSRYRGCRRASVRPSGRFFGVLTSLLISVGGVGLATGAAMPMLRSQDTAPVQASAQLPGRVGQAGTDNRASRNGARGSGASTVDQAAPDIWLLPIRSYKVTSPFGRRWGRSHLGVDLAAPQGTPIYAVAAGTVTVSRNSGGYGLKVTIDHGDGITSVYGHSSKLLAREGHRVRAGDKIALVGNTGHSFGAHLHFEIRQDEEAIEPTAFLKAHGVDVLRHADAIEDRPSSD